MERLLVRPHEAGDMLGVSRSKAYELIARGELPVVRVGKSVRVPVDRLRAWIDQQVAAQDSRGAA